MSEPKINFIFIRHGIGCHNINRNQNRKIIDPPLTKNGITYTFANYNLIKSVLEKKGIKKIDMYASSPALRTIETTFLFYLLENAIHDSFPKRLTLSDKNKIHIMPYLREIYERVLNADVIGDSYLTQKNFWSKNIYKDSDAGALQLKNINEQKKKLQKDFLSHLVTILKNLETNSNKDIIQMLITQSKNLLENDNFLEFNEKISEREEPGDIPSFINYFIKDYLPKINLPDKIKNVLIVTHAGVLNDYRKQLGLPPTDGYSNNDGFILTVSKNKPVIDSSLIPTELIISNEQLYSSYKTDAEKNIDNNICKQYLPFVIQTAGSKRKQRKKKKN